MTLVTAAPASLLSRTRAELERPGYALRFQVEGPPGAIALQRVETRVRLTHGDEVAVEYHAIAWEYFALGPAPEPRADVHDFDARRDGWAAGSIERLLRRQGRAAPAGSPRLEVTKELLLGPGVVEGVRPARRSPGGGAFGLLAEGEAEPSSACLWLVGEPAPGAAREVERAGRGRFTDHPRLAAHERLVWTPATGTGWVERRGYEPIAC